MSAPPSNAGAVAASAEHAIIQLERSRERLRQRVAARAALEGDAADLRLRAGAGSRKPVTASGVLTGLLGMWWRSRQGARTPTAAAGPRRADPLGVWAQPVADRHPLALLGLAAFGGALLVLMRPWRSPTIRRQMLVLMSGLVAKFLADRSTGSPLAQLLARVLGRTTR